MSAVCLVRSFSLANSRFICFIKRRTVALEICAVVFSWYGVVTMNKPIKCPQCGAATNWQGNPQRPFCSERCRMVDLAQWADESYRIPGPPQDPLSDENIVSFIDKKQDLERL